MINCLEGREIGGSVFAFLVFLLGGGKWACCSQFDIRKLPQVGRLDLCLDVFIGRPL